MLPTILLSSMGSQWPQGNVNWGVQSKGSRKAGYCCHLASALVLLNLGACKEEPVLTPPRAEWSWCSLASLDATSVWYQNKDAQSCSTMHVWSAAPPLVHCTAATLLLPHSRESTGETWQVSRATLYMQAGSGLTVWALLIFFTSHWPSPV